MTCPFIHLRTHSSYSLAEGALSVKALCHLASQHQMPALALTDTGNLFGALEFSETFSAQGIQPILGCSLKIDGSFFLKEKAAVSSSNRYGSPFPTLAFLAQNEQGYANLMRLSTRFWLENSAVVFPHIAWELLTQHHEGLICLTGGHDGPLYRTLAERLTPLTALWVENLQELFGDRLYIEIQRHGLETEIISEEALLEIAYARGIPIVATHEPFFSRPDDFEAHDALLCIAEGAVVSAQDRRRLTPEHFFTSSEEMAERFFDLPEALENTREVAQRCAFRPQSRPPMLPQFSQDEAQELRRVAEEGLKNRLKTRGLAPGYALEDYEKRLHFELDVIIKMQFPGYFLIVADFIAFAKTQGIPVGPGRGSGAGSLVAYVLSITDLDPLRFKLLFERFLNPERVSMPDFDIDFCQDRRDEVIAYVQSKYGKDYVAHIITFGKLQARAVCRDVGRVLGMSYGHVDRLCKLIPNNPANPVTLKEAIEGEPKLQFERDQDETVSKMLEIGQKLEGLYRHASTHAAGVVIGNRPLEELVALYQDPKSFMPATQFNLKWVELAGLVKFDFLGLKTLTVIEKAQRIIQEKVPDFDITLVDYNDPKTYEMLSSAETIGVFQFESSGMRDVLRKVKPDCIEDLIAIVALFRPGPMDNIPRFVACKRGDEPPDFLHPWLEEVLKETYGVIVYQEQVMQIAQILAGYSLGEADLLRRAMGKKIKAEMDAQKDRFVSGARQKGVDQEQAASIFELVAKFAGYGFNKSHAACYAILAYQTAYLKAHFPVAFFAASMTYDRNNTDKLHIFKTEAQRLGIPIFPPSINKSEGEFIVRGNGIAYALCALKNVGQGGVDSLVSERKKHGLFRSLSDFACRFDPRQLNKRALESFAKAGVFDALNPNRAQVLTNVELLLSWALKTVREANTGQSDLFSHAPSEETTQELPLLARLPWHLVEKLNHEYEAVGFYLSGHPLEDYLSALPRLRAETWLSFVKAVQQGKRVGRLVGTVSHKQERRSAKSGQKYAFVGFSDPTGQFEAICFSDTLKTVRDLLEPGSAVLLTVEAEYEGSDVKLRIQGVEALEHATSKIAMGLTITVETREPIPAIQAHLSAKGRSPIHILVSENSIPKARIALPGFYQVTPSLKSLLRTIEGVKDVGDL